MQGILDRAVTLPNGRKAFLAANGEARTIDGNTLDPVLVAGIDWTGRPTWEEYQTQVQRLQALDDLAGRNAALLNEVGEIQDRLDDNDRPTPDELEGINDGLSDILGGFDGIEQGLQSLEPTRAAQPVTAAPTSEMVIPDLG